MGGPKGNCHNPNGRPQKPIEWSQFESLCELQCTQSEIASFLKIHPNTLSDRVKDKYNEDYATIYKKYSESGKCSLRRNQFLLSKKNAAMAIWLGKQWLGQKDSLAEMLVSEDIKAKYDALMKQLGEAQARRMAEINSKTEVSSAAETGEKYAEGGRC